ncbi:MAG: hypothetical protein QOG96_2274, partial [Pseudonocardiales bacterium]|nr:hypothetical protein [Pseudonocardiales bacterium]
MTTATLTQSPTTTWRHRSQFRLATRALARDKVAVG